MEGKYGQGSRRFLKYAKLFDGKAQGKERGKKGSRQLATIRGVEISMKLIAVLLITGPRRR